MTLFPSTALAAEELRGPAARALLNFVESACRSKTKYPGPSPCSVERRNFSTLARARYHLAAKNDGVRAALVCLRADGVDYVAFMDRARRLYALHGSPLHVCTAWFQGTLLDGELVRGSEFLAFDAAVVAGVAVGHLPFSARQAAMAPGIALHLRAHESAGVGRPPVLVYMKAFSAPDLFDVSDCTAEGSDGAIAMPEDHPYVVGRHTALFKVKQKHTIDFQVAGAEGDLAVLDRGGLRVVERLAPGVAPLPAGCIVECVRAAAGGWTPLVVRDDKTYPNDFTTYRNTLKNEKEAIGYAEFVEACKRSC